VQVLLSEVLAQGSRVSVEFASQCAVFGEVVYCNPYESAYCAGIYFEPDNSRKSRAHPRFQVHDEKATVALMSCATRSQLEARVVDASKSGLGLILPRPLAAGDWVRVETRSCVVFGDIVYCEPHAAGGYRGGLAIETVVPRFGGEVEGAGGPPPRNVTLSALLSMLGWSGK